MLKGILLVPRCPARFFSAIHTRYNPTTLPRHPDPAARWFALDSSNMCSFVGTDVFGALGALAHDALCNGSHFEAKVYKKMSWLL